MLHMFFPWTPVQHVINKLHNLTDDDNATLEAVIETLEVAKLDGLVKRFGDLYTLKRANVKKPV